MTIASYIDNDNKFVVMHETEMPVTSVTSCITEVQKKFNRVKSVVVPRFDGFFSRVTYYKGNVIRIETQGNGEYGEDVTHLAKYIKNLPKNISDTSLIVVEGELVSDDFASRDIEFIANYMNRGVKATCTSDALQQLAKYGFKVAPYIEVLPSMCLAGLEYCSEQIMKDGSESWKTVTGSMFRFDDLAYERSLQSENRISPSTLIYDKTYVENVEESSEIVQEEVLEETVSEDIIEETATTEDLVEEVSEEDVLIETTEFEDLFLNKKFHIAGSFSDTQSKIKARVLEHGGIFSSSLDETVDILIAGNNADTKVQKAEALGITILTQEDLDRYL